MIFRGGPTTEGNVFGSHSRSCILYTVDVIFEGLLAYGRALVSEIDEMAFGLVQNYQSIDHLHLNMLMYGGNEDPK